MRRQRGLDHLAVRARRAAARAPGRSAASPRSGTGSAAGSVSQLPLILRPGNTCATRCGTATISHSRPFAACTVRTWTRPGATSTSPGREPVFRALGGVEVVEQRGQGGDLGAGGEVGHDVGERVEVRAADGPGPGGGLRIEQQQPLGVGDEVRQRHRRAGPQAAQLVGEPPDPGEARRGVAAGLARVVQRVDEPGLLGVLAGQRAERQLGGASTARDDGGGPAPARGRAPRARRGPPRPAASADR